MKHQLRRIGVLSTAKIAFFIYWAIGIVMALVYGALFGMMSALDPTSVDPELSGLGSLIGGMGAIVLTLVGLFLSVVYGIFAAVAVALAAAGYNLLARLLGGIEFELVPSGGAGSAGSAIPPASPSRTDVVWTPVTPPAESFPPASPASERETVDRLPPPPSHPSESSRLDTDRISDRIVDSDTDPDAPWKPPSGA